MATSTGGPAGRAGPILATGFAITVAMWATAYVAMAQPGQLIGELLFAITLMWLLVGGVSAGRHAGAGLADGILIGVVSATVNMMLVGSLLDGDTPRETFADAVRWGAGTYVVSIVLTTVGVAIGAAWRRRTAAGPIDDGTGLRWYHGFVCVAACAVFLLLVTGGLVTGFEAGLAVPDWPNSFGHNMLLYPVSEMVGGVFYEHAHRLSGMLVGLTTITLAATLFMFDSRRSIRVIGLAALFMVCVQGVLGGLRVTGHLTLSDDPRIVSPNTALAVVHGVFGQVVFATIVAIAAMTAPLWRSSTPPTPKPTGRADRGAAIGLVAMLVLQLVLGALYRHLNGVPGVAPSTQHMILSGHLLLAGLVTLKIIFVGGRAWGRYAEMPVIPQLGVMLMLLVALQLTLGAVALVMVLMYKDADPIPMTEVVVTTGHQSCGALLLATSVLLMVWSRRLIAPQAGASGAAGAPGESSDSGS